MLGSPFHRADATTVSGYWSWVLMTFRVNHDDIALVHAVRHLEVVRHCHPYFRVAVHADMADVSEARRAPR